MKRRFLLWLDSFRHKPKFLKRMIDMAYWADILHIQEAKKRHQSELDKRLSELESRLAKDVDLLRRTFLLAPGGQVVMTKLTPAEANKKMIEMMKEYGIKDEEIENRVKFLGFELVEEQEEKTQEEKPKSKRRVTKNGRTKITAKAHA